MRGTVSTLWANTSGRDENTSPSRSGLPEKSVARISTPVPGFVGVDPAHGLGVQPGAFVGQVVAGDAGDGGVAQLHGRHGFGDPARLVGVVVGRLAGVDLAEVAPPRALRAADEERRLAVLPALVDVRAAGLLADGVQAFALHEVLQPAVLRAHPRLRLDPVRLLLDRRRRVPHLEAEELATAPGDLRGRSAAAARAHAALSVSATSAAPSASARKTATSGVEHLRRGDGPAGLETQRRDAGVGDPARNDPRRTVRANCCS